MGNTQIPPSTLGWLRNAIVDKAGNATRDVVKWLQQVEMKITQPVMHLRLDPGPTTFGIAPTVIAQLTLPTNGGGVDLSVCADVGPVTFLLTNTLNANIIIHRGDETGPTLGSSSVALQSLANDPLAGAVQVAIRTVDPAPARINQLYTVTGQLFGVDATGGVLCPCFVLDFVVIGLATTVNSRIITVQRRAVGP